MFRNIRQNGRRTVEANFRFQPMVDAIEDSLERMASADDTCRFRDAVRAMEAGVPR
jgi:hypothetical protein